MNRLAVIEDMVYGSIAIDCPEGFTPPFSGVMFACLIWDHDGRFTDAQRAAVARILLEDGCRYVVCGGENCAAWENDVDFEFVLQHLDDPEELRETAHVMTTSHSGESPDDVAFFFVFCTRFDGHDFKRYLVLHIGSRNTREQVDDAVRGYAFSRKS